MKISGTAVLNAPIDQVWAAFNDPAVLARTIPGCLELREVGPDAYTMTLMAGVASIKGTYEGNVALTEQNPPSFFVLRAAGAGAPGTVSAVIASAIEDAEGFPITSMPISPDELWNLRRQHADGLIPDLRRGSRTTTNAATTPNA